MPRKKWDGFDDVADFLRRNPLAALRTGRVLRILYSPESVDRASEIVRAVQACDEKGRPKLLGPEVVGSVVEAAAVEALAPKRKAGRPQKGAGPVALIAALRNAEDRTRIDEVAEAIVSDLPRTEAVEEMRQAARKFSARRSRPVAFEAMKRFRARLEEVEAVPRKRTPDDRPRLLAARVVLEARDEPATAEDGRRLLRRLQRGNVVREAKLAEGLGILHAREEDVTALLATIERLPKRAR